MRRKLAPNPLPRATTSRLPAAASERATPAYAAVLAQLRGRAIGAALAIVPLASLLGSVSACGGAAPVEPYAILDDGGPDGDALTKATPILDDDTGSGDADAAREAATDAESDADAGNP